MRSLIIPRQTGDQRLLTSPPTASGIGPERSWTADVPPGTVRESATGCGQAPQAKRLRDIILVIIMLLRDSLYGISGVYSAA